MRLFVHIRRIGTEASWTCPAPAQVQRVQQPPHATHAVVMQPLKRGPDVGQGPASRNDTLLGGGRLPQVFNDFRLPVRNSRATHTPYRGRAASISLAVPLRIHSARRGFRQRRAPFPDLRIGVVFSVRY